MKLVIAWLAALALAAITWASCSIPHKSSDFECTTQADCADLPGRVCSGGYCVVTNEGVIDARKPDAPKVDARPLDAPSNACPAQCTSCDLVQKTCKIDCAQTNCQSATIVCPTGYSCAIECSTTSSCRDGIDCTGAKSCDIGCSGNGSCRDIECGLGECQISCTGQNSCRDIICTNACACDVTCSNAAACDDLSCKAVGAFTCSVFGGGCTSARLGCDTCQ